MASNISFSPSAAWNEVWAWLNRHANAFAAIAGVFFLLPALVLYFFGPAAARNAEAMFANIDVTDIGAIVDGYQALFLAMAPFFIILTIIQIVGQLAILAIAANRGAATVGEAISTAFSKLGYMILAQIVYSLLLGLVFGVLALLIGAIAAVAGFLAVLLALPLMVLAVYLAIRFSLIPAVLIAEDIKWPIPLLQRSWELTGGNVLMIFVYFLMIGIVFFVISIVIGAVFGILFAMFGGIGMALSQVVQGIVSAIGTTIFTLMPLSILRQLAPSDHTSEVFR